MRLVREKLYETFESYSELKKLAKEIYALQLQFEKPTATIRIKYFINEIVNVNNYDTIKDFINSKVLFSLGYNTYFDPWNNLIVISDFTFSSILHELQHAYNHFISRGHINSEKETQRVMKRLRHPSPDIAQNSYYRNVDEVSAFFTEAIGDINFFKNDKIRDFKEIFNEFKQNEFEDGINKQHRRWDYLTPKIQKNLLRKLSQYWHKIKEEHESKNS